MTRGRFLFAAQKYRCSYICTRCGKENRETGFVRAADPVRLNAFTDNLGDEYHLSGALATDKACRRFYRLQSQVNGHCWYSGLRVSGRCRRCGKRQLWSPFLRHTAAAVLACGTLGAIIWLCGWPADLERALMLTGIAAGGAILAEGVSLLAVWLWAKHQDEDGLPWVEAVRRKAN